MNREDLLKKCVDRGVADETSVGTVSHLFYVYLLSALQKGQRVEIPNFGTFGTRVVGVKRARRMPFFEVEKEFADKVNERYRELNYLLLGKYELIPSLGEEEYAGKESPHDPLVDQMGKEVLVDTHRDVTVEEYERSLAASKGIKPIKEKRLMPKLNLKDEGMEPELTGSEEDATTPPPTLRDNATSGGGPSPLVQALIAVLVLGILTFGLNYFGVIHLWGNKTPKVVEALPQPEAAPPVVEAPQQAAPVTPTPVPTPPPTKSPKPSVPITSTGGKFTVQVSAWMTTAKANEEVQRLTAAGFDAFVEDASVSGEQWYRVRVGRYGTEQEATAAAAQLQQMLEDGIWVAKVGH